MHPMASGCKAAIGGGTRPTAPASPQRLSKHTGLTPNEKRACYNSVAGPFR